MKKLLIAAMLVAALGTTAFASTPDRISYKVTDNFESNYATAKNVRWSQQKAYTKATFELNDQTLEAFYSPDGELLGTSRKMEYKNLPSSALAKIKKNYGSYHVKEVIEFQTDYDKKYYVSMADGNKSQVLEVSMYGAVCLFKGGK